MTEQELYEMKLHEVSKFNEHLFILRVLGGWIYTTQNRTVYGEGITSVFVPEPEKEQQINYPYGHPIPYYPPQYPYVPQQPMYWNSPSTTGSGQ